MTGIGKDTVTNSKTIYGDVLLAGGDDTFKNVAGTVFGGVALGMGFNPDGGALNKLENSGTIYGDIDGSTVVDNIKNTKTILGNVELYGGNDIVDNKTGTIRGYVDLGEGDDKYDGGAVVDDVTVGDGADTVTLGAGDDYLDAFKDSFVDTYDGGVGTKDELDLSDSAVGVVIDMTTLVLGKGTVTYAGEAAVDKAGGFEWFIGTSSNDEFRGSLTTAVNETIYGLEGSDTIIAGRGKDVMFGGFGPDDGDGVSDSFVFTSAADSGITTATRDVIGDFEVGLDKIRLAFDSDSTTAGVQAFEASDFLGVNTEFTGEKGEIRAIQVGMFLVVQADTNGDKKADFSVALGGDPVALQGLSSSDFDFTLI
jgi:serralysin